MFGEINEGEMMLNEQGDIANEEWFKTNEIRKNIDLDVFVVMPNHIHGIIVITHNDDFHRGVLHTPLIQNTPWNKNPNPFDQKTQIQENIHLPGVCNTPLHSPSATIGAMVRGYKSSVTKRINQSYHCNGFAVWQRNYHDHIIRDHASYMKISEYITHNPANWEDDILFNR
jgi:REP element-mobilizing transposase RayT